MSGRLGRYGLKSLSLALDEDGHGELDVRVYLGRFSAAGGKQGQELGRRQLVQRGCRQAAANSWVFVWGEMG